MGGAARPVLELVGFVVLVFRGLFRVWGGFYASPFPAEPLGFFYAFCFLHVFVWCVGLAFRSLISWCCFGGVFGVLSLAYLWFFLLKNTLIKNSWVLIDTLIPASYSYSGYPHVGVGIS